MLWYLDGKIDFCASNLYFLRLSSFFLNYSNEKYAFLSVLKKYLKIDSELK